MGLGEELEAVCRNSAGRRELKESDASQAQPERAAGCSHQLLRKRKRTRQAAFTLTLSATPSALCKSPEDDRQK